MRHTWRTGLSFGVTSGIITTLGLMAGLHSGTHSKAAVMGGVLAIAVADAFSDAMGIHMAEEAAREHTHKEIWESTCSTFLSKFLFSMTFVVPLIFFPLGPAILVNIAWGLSLLVAFNYILAKRQGIKPWRMIGEHLTIAVAVIIITHLLGDWIAEKFGNLNG